MVSPVKSRWRPRFSLLTLMIVVLLIAKKMLERGKQEGTPALDWHPEKSAFPGYAERALGSIPVHSQQNGHAAEHRRRARPGPGLRDSIIYADRPKHDSVGRH